MDFKTICRICLKSNEEIYDIFTYFCTKRRLLYSHMLTCCTKLQVFELDGLPKHICKECSKQLKKSYSFSMLCEDSDKKLKELFLNKDVQESQYLKNELVPIGDIAKLENEVKQEQDNFPIENGSCKELNYNDDGNDWDDDDDVLLEDIKAENSRPQLKEDIPKKQVKRKKDSALKGDCNENSWQESDTLLDDSRIGNEGEFNETVKKKRGRKKKVSPDGCPQLPESKLPHQCDICGKFLSTKSNLKAHKVCHTDARPYKCEECPAAFRGYSALFQHKKVHSGETPYHCEYCPKKFGRRTGLVNHIRMHTGEKIYSCEICFKTFVQRAQLSVHMKRHKGEKPYLCQDCGKGFPIKSDLKVHLRIHNGEKPYACHLCNKTFATSGNLSIHVRIHNKEVRYNCKICERGFVTCSSYNVHVKRHKGQRDYSCECGKTFYTSSSLKQHQVVHTGEKKYQCKICKRKFTQTSHLSRHFKKDHMKPNAPLPSSEQYKLIVPASERLKDIFVYSNVQGNVKCENT